MYHLYYSCSHCVSAFSSICPLIRYLNTSTFTTKDFNLWDHFQRAAALGCQSRAGGGRPAAALIQLHNGNHYFKWEAFILTSREEFFFQDPNVYVQLYTHHIVVLTAESKRSGLCCWFTNQNQKDTK